MKIDIHFEQRDIQKVLDTIATYQDCSFVQERIQRNLSGHPIEPSKEEIWWTMMMCLLTSQQKSNPQSSISRFLGEKPFRLSLKRLQATENVELFAYNELHGFGGIRFAGRIASHIKYNLDTLHNGEWKRLEDHLFQLLEQRKLAPKPEHFELEREAAQFISRTFLGFGPKQSRNFWQEIGVTRYEFVLDSRVNKWLRQLLDFPIPLSPLSMSDENFYCYISDILRDLCIQADVLPCILDAAVFSSYDI